MAISKLIFVCEIGAYPSGAPWGDPLFGLLANVDQTFKNLPSTKILDYFDKASMIQKKSFMK
jgi:hypothetical protein